jgi:hypothetical protein
VEDRKGIGEMFGDFLREAAVLTAVFVPMDRIIGQRSDFTPNWFFVTALISASLLLAGILTERLRK